MSIRLLSLAGAASLVLLTAACATAPAGMQAGRFVDYACDNNARFSARLADDGKTVRVRSIHGAAELADQGGGRFADSEFVLTTGGERGISLEHNKKVIAANCKRA